MTKTYDYELQTEIKLLSFCCLLSLIHYYYEKVVTDNLQLKLG